MTTKRSHRTLIKTLFQQQSIDRMAFLVVWNWQIAELPDEGAFADAARLRANLSSRRTDSLHYATVQNWVLPPSISSIAMTVRHHTSNIKKKNFFYKTTTSAGIRGKEDEKNVQSAAAVPSSFVPWAVTHWELKAKSCQQTTLIRIFHSPIPSSSSSRGRIDK